jgi:hypothetical protein
VAVQFSFAVAFPTAERMAFLFTSMKRELRAKAFAKVAVDTIIVQVITIVDFNISLEIEFRGSFVYCV